MQVLVISKSRGVRMFSAEHLNNPAQLHLAPRESISEPEV
jgi:hypothetical protein